IAISTARGDQANPAVAASARFLVTWDDARSGSTDVYGARVGRLGNVLDPRGFRITGAPGAQTEPDIEWNGSEYLAVWQDARSGEGFDIYGSRVSPRGIVLDPNGVAISTGAGDRITPAIAAAGQFLVVLDDARLGGDRFFAARVGADATVEDPTGFKVSSGSN